MRIALVVSAMLVLSAVSVFAQSAPPACDGDITIVRISQITPGGSMQGFLAAVAAQKAWYRANGITDNEIFAARVMVRDPQTGKVTYSETEALTYHIRPPARERTPKRGDDSWNAYVKQYRENSQIKSEYMTCMPKPPRN